MIDNPNPDAPQPPGLLQQVRQAVEGDRPPARSDPGSPILQWFDFDHLPDHLQGVSRAFRELAYELEERLGSGPEKSTALRKLLEAKDAAVRQAVLDYR